MEACRYYIPKMSTQSSYYGIRLKRLTKAQNSLLKLTATNCDLFCPRSCQNYSADIHIVRKFGLCRTATLFAARSYIHAITCTRMMFVQDGQVSLLERERSPVSEMVFDMKRLHLSLALLPSPGRMGMAAETNAVPPQKWRRHHDLGKEVIKHDEMEKFWMQIP
jgi:hypothetical protein